MNICHTLIRFTNQRLCAVIFTKVHHSEQEAECKYWKVVVDPSLVESVVTTRPATQLCPPGSAGHGKTTGEHLRLILFVWYHFDYI